MVRRQLHRLRDALDPHGTAAFVWQSGRRDRADADSELDEERWSGDWGWLATRLPLTLA
jgi:hypothetical protein